MNRLLPDSKSVSFVRTVVVNAKTDRHISVQYHGVRDGLWTCVLFLRTFSIYSDYSAMISSLVFRRSHSELSFRLFLIDGPLHHCVCSVDNVLIKTRPLFVFLGEPVIFIPGAGFGRAATAEPAILTKLHVCLISVSRPGYAGWSFVNVVFV